MNPKLSNDKIDYFYFFGVGGEAGHQVKNMKDSLFLHVEPVSIGFEIETQ